MMKTTASGAKSMAEKLRNADENKKNAGRIGFRIASVGAELECGIMGPDILRLGNAFERLQFFRDDTVSSFEAIKESGMDRKQGMFIGNAELAYWSDSLRGMNKFFTSAFSCIMSTNRTCSLHVHIKPALEIKNRFAEVFGSAEAQKMLVKSYAKDFKNMKKYTDRLGNRNCVPVFLESNVVRQLSYTRQSMKALPDKQDLSLDAFTALARDYQSRRSINRNGMTIIMCMLDVAESLYPLYSADPEKQEHAERLKEIAHRIRCGNPDDKLASVTQLKKILRAAEGLSGRSQNIDAYSSSLINISGARKTVINLNPINDIGTIEFRLMPHMESADEASDALAWVVENVDNVYNKLKKEIGGLELDFRNFMDFELDMVRSRMPGIKLINRNRQEARHKSIRI
ncbi:MAG: hypothetical protein M1331_02610 [Candidatus Marsarchaeota archaeon]|nr:hypothetical protein [Candidatus Marsarchaeota archaeon]